MSGSRTLLRKNKRDQDRRALPENRGLKPGTRNKHLRDISNMIARGYTRHPITFGELGLEAELHVTKGFRVRRAK